MKKVISVLFILSTTLAYADDPMVILTKTTKIKDMILIPPDHGKCYYVISKGFMNILGCGVSIKIPEDGESEKF